MKSHRKRANLLTFLELDAVLRSMPEKYRRALLAKSCSAKSSGRRGYHINSLSRAVKIHSLLVAKKQTSVCGIRRTLLLQELANGKTWEAVEKMYGAQMVKTACADLVRQCAPNILLDSLAR